MIMRHAYRIHETISPPPQNKRKPNKTTPTCNADKDIKQNRRFWRLKTLLNFPNALSDITIMAYF